MLKGYKYKSYTWNMTDVLYFVLPAIKINITWALDINKLNLRGHAESQIPGSQGGKYEEDKSYGI